MEKFSLFVGLDVSKASFNAAYRVKNKLVMEQSYTNDGSGISGFIQDLLSFGFDTQQILVSLEHCGVYLEKIVMALAGEEIFTWLWNPVIAKLAPLDLTRHKDDPRDAKNMALLCQTYQSKAKRYLPKSSTQRELTALFLLRKQLVKHRAQYYNQQKANLDKAIPNPYAQETFKQFIDPLSAKIKELDEKLKQLIFNSQRLKRMYEILTSIPSVGPVTAMQFIEVTQGFSRFQSEKQLAKYIGVMPLTYESGSSVKRKRRCSKKAQKSLKTNLTMGATSLIRKGLFFHQFYQFKTQVENKEHFKVINILRNMVIKLAFKLVDNDQLFDPDIFKKNKKSWQVFLILS